VYVMSVIFVVTGCAMTATYHHLPQSLTAPSEWWASLSRARCDKSPKELRPWKKGWPRRA